MKRVLAAFPPFVIPTLERVLGGQVAFLPVHTLDEAKALLESVPDISLVACGLYFDESRMFDLLAHVRERFPAMPVICCRMVERELPRMSIDGVSISAVVLGAAAFFDMPTRTGAVGIQAAEAEFRDTVLEHLQA